MIENEIFRSYVPLGGDNGKTCLLKFSSAYPTYEEALNHRGATGVGGILKEGVVLVDFDDDFLFEKALRIIKTMNIPLAVRRTARGGHFIGLSGGFAGFEKCGTGKWLACGLIADIKTGNSNSYEAITVNGEERKLMIVPDELGTMPRFLEPVANNQNLDFMTMNDGSGRNSTLFSYILNLICSGFEREEARETIRIVNEFILKEPLPVRELETVLRDDSFKNIGESFFDKKHGFRHDRLGLYLIQEMRISKIHGELHSYHEGYYVSGNRQIETRTVSMIPTLKNNQVRETMLFIERVSKIKEPAEPKYIGFSNGILNIETGEIIDFTPNLVITNRISCRYDTNAYSQIVEDCLNQWSCNDMEIRKLLEELTGYCFYRKDSFHKFFILTGERANGKSTFLEFITNVIGKENCSALDLSNIGDHFKTAMIAGKLANIGDDIADDFIDAEKTSMIKKITTGERITAENKGKDPFEFVPYAKMIYSANDIPRMKDRSGALIRRMVIIPFNATFTDENRDPFLREKLRSPEACEYMTLLAVNGLKRVLDQKGFTHSNKAQQELDNFEMVNDSIKSFLSDKDINVLFREASDDIYLAYSAYCSKNSFKAFAKTTFNKEICKRYEVDNVSTTIGGQRVRRFMRRV